jgi:hypothetical protein
MSTASNATIATVCAAGTLYALTQIGRSLIALRWPSVEGEIASTRLVHRYDNEDGPTDYQYVAYRYEVGDKPYRNDRVRFGPQVAPSSIVPGVDPEPNNPNAAAALARQYPRGTPVRVYYNPRNPADSVLHRSPSFQVWVILGGTLLFGWLALRPLL